jgi:hypothetical protein
MRKTREICLGGEILHKSSHVCDINLKKKNLKTFFFFMILFAEKKMANNIIQIIIKVHQENIFFKIYFSYVAESFRFFLQ